LFNTSKKIQSPILLITYNRPTLTYNLLKSLGELKISRLYIYVDAASGDIDEKSNLQVKKMVEDFQPKFEVIKVFRENNLGCKNGVYQAINEVLST
jgi:GT2 family glycosyltransferase